MPKKISIANSEISSSITGIYPAEKRVRAHQARWEPKSVPAQVDEELGRRWQEDREDRKASEDGCLAKPSKIDWR
ncbi:MAG: hypothetical protein ACETWO_01675 [Candidatus Hadarchaeaceae archaeon]